MRRTRGERIDVFEETMQIRETRGCINNYDELLTWLIDNGYFDAPASAHHHGTNKGDLFEHSYKVADILTNHTIKLGLQWKRPASPVIVGLFHDLCKIDQYIFCNGGWKYNEEQLVKGHGDKSIMLLSRFMTLTEEEMLCIRYHMGAYNTDDWKQFDLAIRKCPNVLYTHTADMLASKVYNI